MTFYRMWRTGTLDPAKEGECDYVPSGEMDSFGDWWAVNQDTMMSGVMPTGEQVRILFYDVIDFEGEYVHEHCFDW
jgi:hypothetical protein